MSAPDLIRPLAQSFLTGAAVHPRVEAVLRAVASGRELDRAAFSALVGEREPAVEEGLSDFLLFCVGGFLADHTLTGDEKAAVKYLWRLFKIPEGQLAELRQQRVGELLATELGRILEDRKVDAVEAMHQVDLQEVLGLGYDQYVELTRPNVYRVLLHLVNQVDPDMDRVVAEEDLAWYYRQLAALDTVFNLNPERQPQGPESGYLYVLVNPSMDGIVKIGRTARSPILRAREIGSATGVPTPFMLVYEVAVADCSSAERYVHERLEASGRRVAENREFFRVSPSEAIALVQEARVAAMSA